MQRISVLPVVNLVNLLIMATVPPLARSTPLPHLAHLPAWRVIQTVVHARALNSANVHHVLPIGLLSKMEDAFLRAPRVNSSIKAQVPAKAVMITVLRVPHREQTSV